MKKILFIVLLILGVYLYKEKNVINDLIIENTSVETISYKIVNRDILNYKNIKIGDSLDTVLNLIDSPARIDESEYNFKWYVYNQYGKNFAMVGIENDKVVALFSNSIDNVETNDLILNNNMKNVREAYETLNYRKIGNTKYLVNSENQYDLIEIDNKYITVFYDIYENNRICSFLILDKKVEATLNDIYANENERLRESFELQIIDLVNSTRLNRNLSRLNYSYMATISARKHSEDMRDKGYFDHTNKEGKTPFDRMKNEGIIYTSAAENIAAGQTSAIFAHEAWMNSSGHRKNILGDYNNIGVGVSFGGDYKIYYTQNFYYD